MSKQLKVPQLVTLNSFLELALPVPRTYNLLICQSLNVRHHVYDTPISVIPSTINQRFCVSPQW